MGITETLLILVIILLIAIIAVMIYIFSGKRKLAEQDELAERIVGDLIAEEMRLFDDSEERIALRVSEIRRDLNERLMYDSDENRKNRLELSDMIAKGHERMDRSMKEAISSMQSENRKKLEDIQSDISKKLDISLNERLDSSFKKVGDQLNELYKSLGELNRLEEGVYSLNRTLSGVKTRGIYGEVELEKILSDILPPSLYDKNVVTRKSVLSREAVEFAVRIPDREAVGEFMYLPIDSKFPEAAMEKIRKASEEGDSGKLNSAVKELEQRVRTDARDIADKYIDPPYTTDFGIMFLPTESLYSEVLRIPELVNELRRKYHVVVTGPSTVTALINSLSIGFRYMAVNRDSLRVLKLLRAVKTQYGKLTELIETADKRLDQARSATGDLRARTDIINRRLSAVEELDPLEADKLLKDDSAL